MAERLGNLGYLGLVKEVTKGTALTPTDFIPLYDESINKNYNMQMQDPAYGSKHARYATLPGQRDYQGDITVLAEPNTTAKLFDALYTKQSTSGTAPYTHTYEPTGAAQSYTFDLSTGNVVVRYIGCEIAEIGQDWSDNELRHKIKLSAIGSFDSRTIATVATTTITFTTTNNATPNRGLVIGDLVRLYKPSTGVSTDFTIASVNADGITVTLNATAAAYAAGDILYLRPATVAFNLLSTFLWANTVFGFGANATTALANATRANQYRVETGSEYTHMHSFEDNGGAKRSGSFDPAALVRTTDDQSITIKKFFDTPDDIQKANDMATQALVVRHFAGANDQYELRSVFYNVSYDAPFSDTKSGDILYSSASLYPNYDPTTGKATQVVVINNLSTI